jgi:hypothetical protein
VEVAAAASSLARVSQTQARGMIFAFACVARPQNTILQGVVRCVCTPFFFKKTAKLKFKFFFNVFTKKLKNFQPSQPENFFWDWSFF